MLYKIWTHIQNGQWEEYGDLSSIGYQTVLPLINSGVSKLSLSKITGLSRYKIYKMSSYFARFELINTEYLNEYVPTNKNYITTNDILLIINKSETLMRDLAKSKLKIGMSESYYFYYDPVIQESIYNKI